MLAGVQMPLTLGTTLGALFGGKLVSSKGRKVVGYGLAINCLGFICFGWSSMAICDDYMHLPDNYASKQ